MTFFAEKTQSSLVCDVYLPYWISWDSTTLRVGQQSYPSYEIASWVIPENVRHNINFVAFATGPETVGGGLWEFDESPSQYLLFIVATCATWWPRNISSNNQKCLQINQLYLISASFIAAELIAMKTFGTLDYDRFWISTLGRNSLVFSVKSCGHATLALAGILYNTEVQVNTLNICTLQ